MPERRQREAQVHDKFSAFFLLQNFYSVNVSRSGNFEVHYIVYISYEKALYYVNHTCSAGMTNKNKYFSFLFFSFFACFAMHNGDFSHSRRRVALAVLRSVPWVGQ